jgi:hypothetical protein
MNTLENDVVLDPIVSKDGIYSDDIYSQDNNFIYENSDYQENSNSFDIHSPKQEILDPSVQITAKPQEQIQENSIEKPDPMKDQQSQANSNSERDSFTNSRFNRGDGLGGSGVGNAGRLSSETIKPSPMASSRAMDTKLRIANKSGPAWRENYI